MTTQPNDNMVFCDHCAEFVSQQDFAGHLEAHFGEGAGLKIPSVNLSDYSHWKMTIDRDLEETIGLKSDDIKNMPWMTWYEMGMGPQEATSMALEQLEDI